jgi:predicted transcriptional regulator
MQESENKSPLSVKLDSTLRQRLLALSESRDRSVHWLMKHAIEAYVEQEERSDTLRQETLARWDDVEAGKTVDNDRVVEWLETWGGNSRKARPR